MKRKLYIPESVRTKSEIFNGYGFTQLIQTALITIIVGVISFFIYLFHGSLPVLITTILITCASSVTLLAKDATNQSVADYVKNMIRFARSQKKYGYQNGKELF